MSDQINASTALCMTQFRNGAHLWDAELDGGGQKNAKGESSKRRTIRLSVARAICQACPDRGPCKSLGESDPTREGMYGGKLV